jgi:uncharacterized membrane protein YraQ (UPF0718 family)
VAAVGDPEPERVRATGVGLGLQLTFLLGAFGTWLPTLLTSRAVLSTRVTIFYATTWIAFAIGAGVLFGLTVQ